MEQLQYNLLFRWFVGLGMDDTVWGRRRLPKIGIGCWKAISPALSSKTSSRRPTAAPAGRALHDRRTLLEAWAGQRFSNGKINRLSPRMIEQSDGQFHGLRRPNQTQQSTTDPDSRLFKKARGHEAKLAYLGEVLMENRREFGTHPSRGPSSPTVGAIPLSFRLASRTVFAKSGIYRAATRAIIRQLVFRDSHVQSGSSVHRDARHARRRRTRRCVLLPGRCRVPH